MNAHTRIKICGITRAEDALHAVRCGADALGFVLVPASKRAVTAERAAALRRQVPPFVSIVALFLDAGAQEVRHAVEAMQPDLLQFHGQEPPEFCAAFGRPYIKSVAMGGGADLAAAASRYADAAALLIDGHAVGELGGSGQRVALDTLLPTTRPIVLAGGLTPDNVAEAVRALQPWAVDVSSGVESSPGIKDAKRVTAFIAQVRAADEQ